MDPLDSLFEQNCPIHPEYPANQLCYDVTCLHHGLLCQECIQQHLGHNIGSGERFFLILKKLINFDGSMRTPHQLELLTQMTSKAFSQIQGELEQMVDYFKMMHSQFKMAFDKYRFISQDVVVINNFLKHFTETQTNPLVFKDLVQEVLMKLGLKHNQIVVHSIASMAQKEFLYLPNPYLIHQFLEPFYPKIQELLNQIQKDLTTPHLYDKLDLSFTDGLTTAQNQENKPIFLEARHIKEESVIEKFIYDRKDNNDIHENIKNMRISNEMTLLEAREGSERLEKVEIVASRRVWYLDLIYEKFKSKNWIIEPKNACFICKCHPKFAIIREFVHVKYGDLYGPFTLEKELLHTFKSAFGNRKQPAMLFDRTAIYFHDLCLYWSNLVECDEKQGTVNFESFANAIKVSQDIKCHLCKRIGPTLKCNEPSCDIWIHYYCFKELDPDQQHCDKVRHRILCNDHKQNEPDWLFANTFLQKYENEPEPGQ